jgi:hypothetical protein
MSMSPEAVAKRVRIMDKLWTDSKSARLAWVKSQKFFSQQ